MTPIDQMELAMLRALARFFRAHNQLHYRPEEAAVSARRRVENIKPKRAVGEELMGWDKDSPLGKLYAHYVKHTP